MVKKIKKFLIYELKNIYSIDMLRLRSKIFIGLFNIFPDLYCLRYIKNILLACGGMNISIYSTYIKNNFYSDMLSNINSKQGLFVNSNLYIEGLGAIEIGSGVQIGPNVQFLTTNHKNRNKDDVSNSKIGDNVWIGGGCIILPGCEIGDNINIAAGSVVKGKILDGRLYAGNPAIQKR